MPTTAENISLIESAVTGYSRPQIRTLLDELQLIVYAQRTDETLKVDAATGYPPFLATQNNTFWYNCPADCWMTAAIFSEAPIRRYRTNADHGISSTYYWQNKGYYRHEVTSRQATLTARATVTFRENPGTTTDKFYHVYWIKPTRITEESVELVLPEHVHYKMRKAVIAMLQTENYGETGFDDDVIEKAARRIRRELNRGAQGRLMRTPIRQEYLDWNESAYGYWQ